MGYKLQAYLRKNRYGTFAFRWRPPRDVAAQFGQATFVYSLGTKESSIARGLALYASIRANQFVSMLRAVKSSKDSTFNTELVRSVIMPDGLRVVGPATTRRNRETQQRLPEANKEPRWLVGRGKVQHLTRRRSWFAASMHRMKPLDSFEPTLMQSPHGCARSLVLSNKTWIKAVRPPWTAVRSTAQRTPPRSEHRTLSNIPSHRSRGTRAACAMEITRASCPSGQANYHQNTHARPLSHCSKRQ